MKTVAERIMDGEVTAASFESACDMMCAERYKDQWGCSTRWIFRDGSQLLLGPDGVWWTCIEKMPMGSARWHGGQF